MTEQININNATVGVSSPSTGSGHAESGTRKKRVAVGISGGVDSSVAAALLIQQGYEVIGVHMLCFDEDVPYCTATEDREYALRVAARLEIPLKIYDFRQEYRTRVIDYLVSEYGHNRTPNPDIVCNRDIKFGIMLDTVLEDLGVDYVATGHYAQKNPADEKGLYMAVDPGKDQSYFLALLTSEQLSKTLFPLGGLEKGEVRRLADRLTLPTSSRPDSQGICFVGDVSIREFLKDRLQVIPGEVVSESGNVVGTHSGLPLYTVGQRHGFSSNKGGESPLFVVGKHLSSNSLIVGERASLLRESISVGVSHFEAVSPLYVRIRHLGKMHPCTVQPDHPDSSVVSVSLEEPIEAVAPGQIAVFYSKDSFGMKVVGAGEIL